MKIYSSWAILIAFLTMNCENSKLNNNQSDIGISANVIDASANSNRGAVTLDSMEQFKEDQLYSKIYFYHDHIQNLDTLITEYYYSEEANKLLLDRVSLVNAKDTASFFNIPPENINLGENTSVHLIIKDTLPNSTKKQGWRISRDELNWTFTSNTKRNYENGRIKRIYFYSKNGGYKLVDYIYKDTFLQEINHYQVSGSDSSMVLKEELRYDGNNNLVAHLKFGFFKTPRRKYLSSKGLYTYDEKGNKLGSKHFSYSSTMPDSLKLEEESSYRYNDKNELVYSSDFSVFTSAKFSTTYIYDNLGNCISHEQNRDDHGYNYVKKEFKYDERQRVIKYTLLHKNSEKEVYDTTEIQAFDYYKETSFLKRLQIGRSSATLQTKRELEFDEHGNIIKAKGVSTEGFTDFIFDYNTPMTAVVSDNLNFYQIQFRPEITNNGIRLKRIKVKVSHAISSRTHKRIDGDKQVPWYAYKFYYSQK